MPKPAFGQVGLIAAWDDDAALDRFLANHHVAEIFDGGYRVRLAPLRIVGAWPEFGELAPSPAGGADDGPVAALTLGRLRLGRAPSFLRTSARAESDAVASPDVLLATGLARPPRLVVTFSVWRDLASMRDFAARHGGGHSRAVEAHASKPFHTVSAFIRFRPYDETGHWPPKTRR